MPLSGSAARASSLLVLGGVLTSVIVLTLPPRPQARTVVDAPETPSAGTVTVARRSFVRTIRLHGLVEPVRSYSVTAPRLVGPGFSTLVVVRLARSGSLVKAGDLLVEFDRQNQLKTALDRQADYRDLLEQIKKKQAEQATVLAHDRTELVAAENAVKAAQLEMLKNEMLSRIEAEKNQQRLEEAEAHLAALRTTFTLKREAASSELRILEIQRDRALNAMRHAEANARRMAITAPMPGLVVAKTIWKGGQMGEVQEGEEVRPGVPLLQVVDPAGMQVRARINQTDVAHLKVGQPAVMRLDAYPGSAFPAKLEALSPIAITSSLSVKIRAFVAVFSLQGTSENLLPDLSAAIDVEVERLDDVLVAPRDALVMANDSTRGWSLRVQSGARTELRPVEIGSRSDQEVVILKGLEAGAVVVRGQAEGDRR
jgi:HlyD family secretion protein